MRRHPRSNGVGVQCSNAMTLVTVPVMNAARMLIPGSKRQLTTLLAGAGLSVIRPRQSLVSSFWIG